jgi:hypothetical protein
MRDERDLRLDAEALHVDRRSDRHVGEFFGATGLAAPACRR